MITPPRLLARAAAAGLVGTADVLDGRVTIDEASRSNVVHRVTAGGRPVAYAKQRGPASLLDGDLVVDHESTVLRVLEGLECMPALAGVPGQGAVWTRPVPGVALSQVPADPSRVAEAVLAFGAAVASLHAWPVDPERHPLAPRPWALEPGTLPPSMQGSQAGSLHATVLEALQENAIADSLERAAREWGARSWIHGDLAATNVLVDGHAQRGVRGRRVRFVDVEGAGLGDPGWDLACALGTVRDLGTWWGVDGVEAARWFQRGYQLAGGRHQVTDALECARAVTTAWQAAAAEPAGGGAALAVRAYLDDARSYAGCTARAVR